MDSERHRFNCDGSDLCASIVEAVAHVTDTRPEDVEPLHRSVDLDALGRLLDHSDGVQARFTHEGLDVTVTSDHEITIEGGPGPDSLLDEVDGATNVLLLAPSMADSSCAELLAGESRRRRNTLGVTFEQSAQERLRAWDSHFAVNPENTTIVRMGTITRGSSAAVGGTPTFPISLIAIEESTNLDELGRRITEQLDEWDDGRTGVCFHSLTALLANVDRQRALRFLRTLGARFESSSVTAHYHLDPDAHDEETVATIAEFFDAVVEIGTDGEWVVRSD